MIEGRDSRGRFIKGNVPWNNKKPGSNTRRGITFTCKFCVKRKPIEEMAEETEVAGRFFPPLPICKDCLKLLENR